jgi:DNA-binding transcriptional regulator YdaS (Cro superfamily)
MQSEVIQKATEAFGSAAQLARALGITRSAISQWRVVPVNRVRDIERLTGIHRSELRPDIFGASE